MARNRSTTRRDKQAMCTSAAQNALLNASKSGFQSLSTAQPLVQDFSSSSNSDEMVADLAARQIEHCLEAWNYLSQSMIALLNGKENIAIHLAYYAEVRSANSLLASTGIAIKERTNYYIDNSKNRRAFVVPTHLALRLLWEDWCKRPDSIEAFESLNIAPSTKLMDVSNAMGLTGSHQNSLLRWGYELVHFSDDHKTRNVASYNASKVYDQIPSFDEPVHGEFIMLIWEHLSSTGIAGQFKFEQLYAQYLIWCYCLDYATTNNNTGASEEDEFISKYDEIISTLSNSTGANQSTLRLILPVSLEEDGRFKLFYLASSQETKAQNIISRAFILSRLSTNKLNNNLVQSSCTAGISWIKTWLYESGILSEDINVSDVFDSSGDFINTAEELSNIPNREIWTSMPNQAIQSCRLDMGLCWGLDL